MFSNLEISRCKFNSSRLVLLSSPCDKRFGYRKREGCKVLEKNFEKNFYLSLVSIYICFHVHHDMEVYLGGCTDLLG